MATKRLKAKLLAAGGLIADFAGSHHLNEASDLRQALLLLDAAIHELETVSENLSYQIDGQVSIFTTSQPFSNLRVVLNGLEQSEGLDADYIVVDHSHLQFYRPLKTTETLHVEYNVA